MPEWLGKTIGKVRIEKPIASEGMAEVYLGSHLIESVYRVPHNLLNFIFEFQPAIRVKSLLIGEPSSKISSEMNIYRFPCYGIQQAVL